MEKKKNEVTIINKFKDESSRNIQETIESIFKTFYEHKKTNYCTLHNSLFFVWSIYKF